MSACQLGRVSGAVSTEGKGVRGGQEGEQWRQMGRNYLGVQRSGIGESRRR